jgi:hypothetical protein
LDELRRSVHRVVFWCLSHWCCWLESGRRSARHYFEVFRRYSEVFVVLCEECLRCYSFLGQSAADCCVARIVGQAGICRTRVSQLRMVHATQSPHSNNQARYTLDPGI